MSRFDDMDEVMRGRRVMVLAGVSRKERTRTVTDILKAAKERWGLTIDVVCQITDRKPFEKLVAPAGKIFSPPHLMKVQDWEREPEQVTALQKRIREAELSYRMPIGRNILASAHSIGRGFNIPLRYPNRYPLMLKVTRDNEEPFRIMRRLFAFAEDALDNARPDVLVAHDWAIPLTSAFWMAAQMRGIQCVAIRSSKVHSDRSFWTTDRLLMNTASIKESAERVRASKPLTETAREYLRAFRDKPRTVAYISARWRDRQRRGFLRWHYEYFRATLRERVNTALGQDLALRELGIVRLYRYYRTLYLQFVQRKYFKTFDNETLAGMKYVYFPMHKEAELAQTFQATPWHDQRNTIRLLASLLPSGYHLLAREHRLNCGLRPTQACKDMAQIPNVTLIDAFDSQFKYIQNANLVVTENGSTGWEALIMGRRLLTLSRTFYDGADLGTKVWDPEKLNEAILQALARREVLDHDAQDSKLGHVIDAELEWTFPFEESGREMALDLLAHAVGPTLRAAESPSKTVAVNA